MDPYHPPHVPHLILVENIDTPYPAVALFPFLVSFNFFLHPVKHLRADDSFTVVLHIVLRDFSFVILDFLGQKVHSEALLQQSIAFVLFIGQDAFDRLLSPF